MSLLLEEGSVIDVEDSDGLTPLLIAAYEGDDKFVELLLRQGADVNLMGTFNSRDIGTALHFAVQSYGIHAKETIETLLKAGADIEALDSDGWTPLHIASSTPKSCMAEIVLLLLEYGADIDKICPKSSKLFDGTALHLALYYDRPEIVEVLLKSGANVHIRNDSGMTPLLVASFSNNFVDHLIQLGADIHCVDKEMKTALHIASASKYSSKAVAFLLGKGASIDLQDIKGRTPLHYACAEGHADSVVVLLEKGAHMDIVCRSTDRIGGSALHRSVAKNRPEIVEILLKAGAGVDVKDEKYGSTPLHTAASHGYCEIANRLMEFGANVNEQDKFGLTPLHLSATTGCDKLVLKLIENGADSEIKNGNWFMENDDFELEYIDAPLAGTAIIFAVVYEHINIVEVLIKAGANIDAGDANGATALHYAASNNNLNMINILLLYGANINCKDGDNYTPLHHAVLANKRQAVKELFELGADINAKELLQSSVKNNFSDITNMLLNFGADLDSRDRFGFTSLHLASDCGFTKVVDLLLKKGANVNLIYDEIGTRRDALQMAVYKII